MSWVEFLASLGIPYPGIKRRRDWTRQLLIAEIRRWRDEGHRLNFKAVRRVRRDHRYLELALFQTKGFVGELVRLKPGTASAFPPRTVRASPEELPGVAGS